jgi:phycoerythrobilin:ferredoxin oxidoreductase
LQEISEDPVSVIQNDVFDAFSAHLDVYLEVLANTSLEGIQQGANHQPAYLQYRRDNDPAKPMLNSLFGSEWTNRLLEEVLFPQLLD